MQFVYEPITITPVIGVAEQPLAVTLIFLKSVIALLLVAL